MVSHKLGLSRTVFPAGLAGSVGQGEYERSLFFVLLCNFCLSVLMDWKLS